MKEATHNDIKMFSRCLSLVEAIQFVGSVSGNQDSVSPS